MSRARAVEAYLLDEKAPVSRAIALNDAIDLDPDFDPDEYMAPPPKEPPPQWKQEKELLTYLMSKGWRQQSDHTWCKLTHDWSQFVSVYEVGGGHWNWNYRRYRIVGFPDEHGDRPLERDGGQMVGRANVILPLIKVFYAAHPELNESVEDIDFDADEYMSTPLPSREDLIQYLRSKHFDMDAHDMWEKYDKPVLHRVLPDGKGAWSYTRYRDGVINGRLIHRALRDQAIDGSPGEIIAALENWYRTNESEDPDFDADEYMSTPTVPETPEELVKVVRANPLLARKFNEVYREFVDFDEYTVEVPCSALQNPDSDFYGWKLTIIYPYSKAEGPLAVGTGEGICAHGGYYLNTAKEGWTDRLVPEPYLAQCKESLNNFLAELTRSTGIRVTPCMDNAEPVNEAEDPDFDADEYMASEAPRPTGRAVDISVEVWKDDNKLRNLFKWLTRIGAAPKFVTGNILHYPERQRRAVDIITTGASLAGIPDVKWVRYRKGSIDAFDGSKWVPVCTLSMGLLRCNVAEAVEPDFDADEYMSTGPLAMADLEGLPMEDWKSVMEPLGFAYIPRQPPATTHWRKVMPNGRQWYVWAGDEDDRHRARVYSHANGELDPQIYSRNLSFRYLEGFFKDQQVIESLAHPEIIGGDKPSSFGVWLESVAKFIPESDGLWMLQEASGKCVVERKGPDEYRYTRYGTDRRRVSGIVATVEELKSQITHSFSLNEDDPDFDADEYMAMSDLSTRLDDKGYNRLGDKDNWVKCVAYRDQTSHLVAIYKQGDTTGGGVDVAYNTFIPYKGTETVWGLYGIDPGAIDNFLSEMEAAILIGVQRNTSTADMQNILSVVYRVNCADVR